MKSLQERETLELLELTIQLFGRMISSNTKEMHDAYWDARRELERRIIHYGVMPGRPIEKDYLGVIQIILGRHELTLDDIFTDTRKHRIVKYRQVIQTLLMRHTKWSLDKIGKSIGGKDHSTVLHSSKVIRNAEFLNHKTGAENEMYLLYKEFEKHYLNIMGQ